METKPEKTTKPDPKLEQASKVAAENAAASENYKKAVGNSFTDGTKTAEVKEYVPSRLCGMEARQCFLVNYGHQNVSFFVPCKEFMASFTPVKEGEAVQGTTITTLPH